MLDSGPLGLLSQPNASPQVQAINGWLLDCLTNGDVVLVPAIVYYEIRRELIRAQKSTGLARLNAFVEVDPDRYLPLTDRALRLAAELWAQSRQQGLPTASSLDLDIDVILAAQTLTISPPEQAIVVTTNPRHLGRFVDAREWQEVATH